MILIAVAAVVAMLVMGLVAKFVLGHAALRNMFGESYSISWAEFAVVAVIMAMVITPTTLYLGKKLSVNNIVTYQQFLHGVETQAVDHVTNCVAGHPGSSRSAGQSNCAWSYDTGRSYSWDEWETETYPCTDASGNTSTCTRQVLRTYSADIYAPYATREHTYTIKSSFVFKQNKPFTFSGVYLDKNPKAYGSEPIPGNIPRGAPADWLDAKRHLDAGNPRPVTALDSYKNYVLASDSKALKAYSNVIDQYKEKKLLPQHAAGIMTDPITGPSKSQVSEVSFVGVSPADKAEFEKSLMQFNAAFGIKLQGDLHVVVVDDTKVPADQAVTYINALKAYWQGPEFGKRALAKNGVIVVLGTNGSTVTWAESSTGMPFGNELMAQYIRDYLPGTDLTPRAIFGTPRTVVKGEKATVTLSSPRGALERIMFEQAPFERASMSCSDADEHCVGYQDLLDTIDPTTTQKVWMLVITAFIALLFWVGVGATSFIDETYARLTGRSTRPTRSYDDRLYY